MGSNEYQPKRTCAYCERDATHKTKGYVRVTYLCKLHALIVEADGFVVEEIKEKIEGIK
jgi:hypothetical protein